MSKTGVHSVYQAPATALFRTEYMLAIFLTKDEGTQMVFKEYIR